MAPKPFPFPIGVGVDLCEISRLERMLLRGDMAAVKSHLPLGRKVFSRLEWPTYKSKMQDFETEKSEKAAKKLATWIGGRWAAKEATIKAHRKRRLHLREISILSASPDEEDEDVSQLKPIALIDPPSRAVLIRGSVAMQRGLKGLSSTKDKSFIGAYDMSLPGEHSGKDDPSLQSLVRLRRMLVKEEERRLAEISITHDGNYAMAVCMALDETMERQDELNEVLDDGLGEPIHEPEWGDKGWPGVD